jgi:hypothetical protein
MIYQAKSTMFGPEAILHPPKPSLEERVVRAAEAALADHSYVSPIDVLTGMGLLAPSNVEAWRKGLLNYLREMIQGSPEKVNRTLAIFQDWALKRGLQPQEVPYFARTIGPPKELRFTAEARPEEERVYRTHYLSPELPAKKRENLEERLRRPPEIVVFEIVRDSHCSQCKSELLRGSFLLMEVGQPLCMNCGDLDHLVFLPRGDTALTRRAKKHSRLSAVVVRFSRARKRYERQGLLVQKAALAQAEEECLSDEDLRARRRQQDALRREEEDADLVKRMAARIRELYPGCPEGEAEAIARHTAARGSGRVGRSNAGRALNEQALRLAVIASLRHNHTDYDNLLMQGVDRASARQEVIERINSLLSRWEAPVRTPTG